MLIVRALPYKDNHCTVKTKQPQQKLPKNAAAVSKACFPQTGMYVLFFLTKPISGVKNKNEKPKSKEKDKKVDFFFAQNRVEEPPIPP